MPVTRTPIKPRQLSLERWAIMGIVLFVSGCATVQDRAQTLIPTRHQLRTGQFILFSNVPLPDHPPEVRCLEALERDLAKELRFHPPAGADPVEIYVLDDKEAFAHFLKFYYPELPPRRAFFLAQGAQRVVYTYSNPRLEEDLRHEATHALLRGAYGDLPLWIDEGLAEYFETDLNDPEAEQRRLKVLTEDLLQGWVPNLVRLEGLNEIRQMTPRDYREAWAWARLMLRGDPADFAQLQAYLAGLRSQPDQPRISARLANKGPIGDRLLAHLKSAPAKAIATRPDSRSGPIRLQDPALEPATPRALPRTLWHRLTGWIGVG